MARRQCYFKKKLVLTHFIVTAQFEMYLVTWPDVLLMMMTTLEHRGARGVPDDPGGPGEDEGERGEVVRGRDASGGGGGAGRP